MDNPYEWLQSAIDQVPEFLQPLIVALAAAVPYIEGEGAAGLGILAGINPVIAAIAAMAGNILCVVLVVLLGSRVREGVVSRRAASKARKTAAAGSAVPADASVITPPLSEHGAVTTATTAMPVANAQSTLEKPATGTDADADGTDADTRDDGKPTRRAKGREKLRRWLVKFGVPGASLLAPLALPTMLTAAFLVGTGVSKRWVILWQVIAIVLWTGAVAIAATGALALLGW